MNEKANQPTTRKSLGERGEQLACEYLKQNGFQLVVTNFITPIGQSLTGRPITGEIDIIAYDLNESPAVLTFIEVKTRSNKQFAAPETAVDRNKQRHIIKAARIYRRLLRVDDEPFRYDVASLLVTTDAEPAIDQPEIKLLRGYFSEQPFAKSRWLRRET